ncbi:WD40-repeat-containing domain protein [Lactarius indigo]|nr:WD40-repeat-containing domain protein [Lactarius indigo]
MGLISYDQSLYETAEETRDALQTACGFMPTDRIEGDIQRLGEQVCKTLSNMCLQKHSERLASQPQTVASLLKLFRNAAVFAADCSNGEKISGSDSRRNILQDFNQQLSRSKRNFFAGKDTYGGREPYISKQDALKLPSVKEIRSEAVIEQEQDAHVITSLDEDAELAKTLGPVIQTSQLNLRCLDSTRGTLLSKIISWSESDTGPNVLWLSGAPGTGKTAIAWSLAVELKNQQRSAGTFFFRQYEHSPYQLWTTLAYKMTKFHPALKCEIYNTVTKDDAPNKRDIQATFKKLIANPLRTFDAQLSSHGPVFLIDGLEQCGQGYTGYNALIDTLPQWLSLPRHCKLIVTSRPQGDIAKVFEDKDITRLELLTGDASDADSDTKNDVRTYLLHRFAKMRKQDKSISENWPGGDAVSRLAKYASGFFNWAAIAVDSIEGSEDKEKQLTSILEGGTSTTFGSLDEYLEETLDTAFQINSTNAFRATMGTIVLSKEPLTMADLGYFLQDRFPSESGTSLEEFCHNLLPIISIEGEMKVVKLRHKAYMDYLTDSKRCADSFLIDPSKTHRRMTISCLKIMQQELKFNICRLESSHHSNFDLEDKDSLIERCIPSRLAYASRFWAGHLRGMATTVKRDAKIVDLLSDFLEVRLLYWLEVLSLLSKSNMASWSLLAAAEWLESTHKQLSLFAVDGSRFALTFADVIAESAPHIYLSALPFSPPSSLVHKCYRDQFPRTIKVIHEEDVTWPSMQFWIPMSSAVFGISIHPGGKKVAAGMSEGVAIVVSVTTGETLCQFGKHVASIRAIAYDPRGERIAAGYDDGQLRVFEAENGILLFGRSELHTGKIRSLAWSPDGQRIVTGSNDSRVKVIATETGNIIYDTAFHNDWVRTVVYTMGFFISGSDDSTVRIYDAATGEASGEAWTTGLTGYIRAIAISPDNKVLAAGSGDKTIVLYDVDRRSTVNQPLRGHTSVITSLEFSKDGQLLASGSEDHTVRLWNVQTGQRICDPLYGHTSPVTSVKFSPDMKQLIVGGLDNSIRIFDMDSLPIWGKFLGGTGPFRAAVPLRDSSSILGCDGLGTWRWNPDNGRVENVPFKGHSERLASAQSVSISPHGTRVATAGRDQAVMIWQADSGRVLCGPLEGHSDNIRALSFSSDEKLVASGGDDRKVWVWSAETGEKVCGPMEGHTSSVKGVCFSPNGKQVASGSDDNAAIIWSVESGEKVLGPLEYHQDWIYGIAYSPDGCYLATGSDDYSVAIWNVASGERAYHVLTGHEGYLRCVNWSSDSKQIVTAALDHLIRVFDVETGALICGPLSGHKSAITSVAFRSLSHSDELEVVSASFDGTVRIWELGMKSFTKTQTFTDSHDDWVHSIAISPVDDHIVSGGDDGKLVVSNVVTGDSKFSFQAHDDWIRCVTYSPDGTMIATCSDDCTISIWNAEDGKRFSGPFSGHNAAVLSIAFSPSGDSLVSGSEDCTVRSWDISSFIGLNNPVSIYHGHRDAVNAVSYARDGNLIVSGSSDAEIAIWERNDSSQPIRRFGGHEGPILSIYVFGEKIFSSSEDRTIKVWELSTGYSLISIPRDHTKCINAIALSPDGQRIVSASDDASIRIFDSNSGEQYTRPLHMSDRVLSVAVSHDGTLVACSGADKSVHVWRANLTHRTVWPDSFMRKAYGQEFCVVDEQGILENFNPPEEDGWLRGSTNETMCWIPPMYRTGLWTPRTLGILGAPEIMLDMRNYVHGTKWEQCRVEDFADKL